MPGREGERPNPLTPLLARLVFALLLFACAGPPFWWSAVKLYRKLSRPDGPEIAVEECQAHLTLLGEALLDTARARSETHFSPSPEGTIATLDRLERDARAAGVEFDPSWFLCPERVRLGRMGVSRGSDPRLAIIHFDTVSHEVDLRDDSAILIHDREAHRRGEFEGKHSVLLASGEVKSLKRRELKRLLKQQAKGQP